MDILHKLFDERDFSVVLSKDEKKATFTECCDYCYDVDLTKRELAELITELSALHKTMRD